MPKVAKELGPLAVRRLAKPGRHPVGGVPGLCLQVTESGARSWVLRVRVGGKRREIGLGSFPAVSLADAREKAREGRERIGQGVDPVAAKRAAASALQAARAKAKTFQEVAEAYISAHAAGWQNSKHADQWTNTLTTYAYPAIGSLIVAEVDTPQVLKVLEPIWTTKAETASRLRGRIEAVLDFATARGYRSGPNPARWKGHLALTLPARSKVSPVKHHAAVAVSEAAATMKRIREAEGMGAQALEFVILTAARSGEVRGATWAEIDLEAMVWTVPAERMKAGKEHRVPLSEAAVDLLNALPRFKDCTLVFPGPKGKALSDMTLTAVLRRLKIDATAHGFRSTFRDWAAECTHYPSEVAEMALAHAVADKVEAAYRRGDLFQKRRAMMDDWAGFLAKPPGKVVPLPSKNAEAA